MRRVRQEFRSSADTVVTRLAQHLDPRTSVVYQRSAVAGQLPGALSMLDRESVTEVAETLGYSSVGDEEPTFRRDWNDITLLWLDLRVEETADGRELLQEEISFPGWMTYVVFAAFLTLFVWIYLPGRLGAAVAVAALVVFGGLLTGFVLLPSPLAQYVDLVRDGKPIGNREEVERLRTIAPDTYQASCIGPPLTALLGGFAATGPIFLTGFPILAREIR